LKDQEWIVIVALGDSLTVGFKSPYGYGFEQNHPYTMRLETLVRDHIQRRGEQSLGVTVVNRGINGDSTDGMIARFQYSVAAEKPTYVIIWAGINDLSSGRTLEYIIGNLSKLYNSTLEIGAHPVACTLTGIRGPSQANDTIRTLNQKIIQHCEKNGISYADLYNATIDKNGSLDQKHSNDGVHLSNSGYNAVADTIFNEIFKKKL
jgi:lysophospholipase L1-like esterase